MKKILLVLLLMLPGICGAQYELPTRIGGFVLNTDIEQYKDVLRGETTLPIRFMEALEEVEVRPRPGFKSGYIAYGTCAAPGKIVRIKLKYKDSSKKYYKKLLKAYRARFGKGKWLGDPFHVVSTWQWSFKEGDQQVNLYLQHNLSDTEEKFGNSVKLTMLNLVGEEIQCFTEKNPDYRATAGTEEVDHDAADWEDLIPR